MNRKEITKVMDSFPRFFYSAFITAGLIEVCAVFRASTMNVAGYLLLPINFQPLYLRIIIVRSKIENNVSLDIIPE